MGKMFSGYPQDSAPTTDDKVPTLDTTTSQNKWSTLADLITLFFNNIPSGAHSDITRGSETFFDFVVPGTGMVWSADNAGVNKNASMTAGTVYINGRRISISAVTARVFTASKDTYIDILDNLDGTGTLVYTEVTNNAASPALSANSIRIGIIVTGATTIANSGSINQGQETKVLPIASSIPYAVTESQGNLICPRDPNRLTLGQRQIITDVTTASATYADLTGLNLVINVPAARKIEVLFYAGQNYVTAVSTTGIAIVDVTSSTTVQDSNQNFGNTVAQSLEVSTQALTPPASGARNYKIQAKTGSGTYHTGSNSTAPAYIIAKLA